MKTTNIEKSAIFLLATLLFTSILVTYLCFWKFWILIFLFLVQFLKWSNFFDWKNTKEQKGSSQIGWNASEKSKVKNHCHNVVLRTIVFSNDLEFSVWFRL